MYRYWPGKSLVSLKTLTQELGSGVPVHISSVGSKWLVQHRIKIKLHIEAQIQLNKQTIWWETNCSDWYCMWMHLQYHFYFVNVKHTHSSITISCCYQGHKLGINLLMGHHRSRVCVTDSCSNNSIRFNRWKINTCASLKVKINTCTSLKVKRSYIEKPLTWNNTKCIHNIFCPVSSLLLLLDEECFLCLISLTFRWGMF